MRFKFVLNIIKFHLNVSSKALEPLL